MGRSVERRTDMLSKLNLAAASVLLLAMVALFSPVVYGGAETEFPNILKPEAFNPSPSGSYRLYDENHDQEPYHSLYLKSETSGASVKVLDFNRHVEVSWKPDSQYFYVNNYYGSDVSDCILFAVRALKGVSVGHILRKSLRSEAVFFRGDPLYITCAQWQGSDVVEVSVSGLENRGNNRKHTIKHYSLNVLTDNLIN